MNLKFHHVFAGLMLMSFVTAFVIPGRYSGRHPEIQALFAPVSVPVGAIARRVHGSVAPDVSSDKRPDATIRTENQELLSEVSRLTDQLHFLQERNQERDKLGPLRALCTPYRVIGGDPGDRESLQVLGSTLQGLKAGMPVLYSGRGIAGYVQRAGAVGAQIRLITDTGFRVSARFRQRASEPGQLKDAPLPTPQVILQGIGHNRLAVQLLKWEDVVAAGIKVDDMLVLDQPEWPPILKGTLIGRVIAVEKSKSPGFADIRVEPPQELLRLTEVMVLVRE